MTHSATEAMRAAASAVVIHLRHHIVHALIVLLSLLIACVFDRFVKQLIGEVSDTVNWIHSTIDR